MLRVYLIFATFALSLLGGGSMWIKTLKDDIQRLRIEKAQALAQLAIIERRAKERAAALENYKKIAKQSELLARQKYESIIKKNKAAPQVPNLAPHTAPTQQPSQESSESSEKREFDTIKELVDAYFEAL